MLFLLSLLLLFCLIAICYNVLYHFSAQLIFSSEAECPFVYTPKCVHIHGSLVTEIDVDSFSRKYFDSFVVYHLKQRKSSYLIPLNFHTPFILHPNYRTVYVRDLPFLAHKNIYDSVIANMWVIPNIDHRPNFPTNFKPFPRYLSPKGQRPKLRSKPRLNEKTKPILKLKIKFDCKS